MLGWDRLAAGQRQRRRSRLGQELAASDAFAECQVQKVFKAVCFRAPGNTADRSAVASIKASFKAAATS